MRAAQPFGTGRRTATARPVRAVLFDLDGTLIDTEIQTDLAISAVTARYGIATFTLPHTETRGRTWAHVADTIRARTQLNVPAAEIADALLAHWNSAVANARAIPGAPQAMRTAAAHQIKLGVVSSSPRSVIDYFLDKLGTGDCVSPSARFGAESVRIGKPNPEGFLLAARSLGVDPDHTVVFEDSRAGLLAAQAAGMRSMFITCCATEIAENAALATATLTDYQALPPLFWSELAAGTADLDHRAYS